MPVKYFVIIDTNVPVSAVLKRKSVPDSIIELTFDGPIAPVLDEDIEAEYRKVLLKSKFHLTEDIVNDIIDTFHRRGLYIDSEAIDIDLPDPKGRVFYGVVMEGRKDEDVYFITGNIRHFPTTPFTVTPRQVLNAILEDQEG